MDDERCCWWRDTSNQDMKWLDWICLIWWCDYDEDDKEDDKEENSNHHGNGNMLCTAVSNETEPGNVSDLFDLIPAFLIWYAPQAFCTVQRFLFLPQ